jgi:hypothetical protein
MPLRIKLRPSLPPRGFGRGDVGGQAWTLCSALSRSGNPGPATASGHVQSRAVRPPLLSFVTYVKNVDTGRFGRHLYSGNASKPLTNRYFRFRKYVRDKKTHVPGGRGVRTTNKSNTLILFRY